MILFLDVEGICHPPDMVLLVSQQGKGLSFTGVNSGKLSTEEENRLAEMGDLLKGTEAAMC